MSVVPASDSPRGLFASPYLLLTLTSLFWGANTIAGQLSVGHISAVSLTCLRWIMTGTIMLGLYRKGLREHWPALRPRVGFLVVMGVIGFTAYNYLFYMAAHSTSALNINIITAAMPAMVLVARCWCSAKRCGCCNGWA